MKHVCTSRVTRSLSTTCTSPKMDATCIVRVPEKDICYAEFFFAIVSQLNKWGAAAVVAVD